jgi:hypothetical protein
MVPGLPGAVPRQEFAGLGRCGAREETAGGEIVMPWTSEQIEKIPSVYRDFMLALKPVLDTRQSVLTIAAIPLGSVYDALLTRYDLTAEQFRQLADNLRKAGLIDEDRLGFLTPTDKGEGLIDALAGKEEAASNGVPPFPDLP